ncbi:Deoxyguanosinetriphosphate triphosphohydrolase-like protein [Vibrio stylophorae]|uniref:Deoxyguanosinetriphosphate triphosphohydrolase-like protein n=1 Tax=Vibrio stylophorae TaxID=659351 RepID=A0ABM8ZV50_9VIBR|nr:anti-phage deoxyguanosine triphosphatase [Vibrio stylophorae]CAH0533846.1 Deoxyguanosinetriphosphate triphosphohydrolase-like protein [Vibrio stylophorae]
MTCIDNQLFAQRLSQEQKQRRNDQRSPFARDRARILHSAAFRRLQAKTQIHGVGAGDFFRTRLTHSIETAQIGTGIVNTLRLKHPEQAELLPSFSLIESLCLAHDIGHPPFGHGGETALNYMMRDHGGFEGNAQTFRIVTKLEPYTEHHGMNLTRRTLLGLIKYPTLISRAAAKQQPEPVDHFRRLQAERWLPAKGIYDQDQSQFTWVLSPFSDADQQQFCTFRAHEGDTYKPEKTQFKSLDCAIMELADDIAYGVHDLEDAIVMGIVHRSQWQSAVMPKLADLEDPWFVQHLSSLTDQLFSERHFERKDAIGAIVNGLITDIRLCQTPAINAFDHPLLATTAKLSAPMQTLLDTLKQFVSSYVIQRHENQLIEYKGQQLVMALFDALSADPLRLLPQNTKQRWQQAQEAGDSGYRVICDYIAGMTDGYAQHLYQQLFSPDSMPNFHF